MLTFFLHPPREQRHVDQSRVSEQRTKDILLEGSIQNRHVFGLTGPAQQGTQVQHPQKMHA